MTTLTPQYYTPPPPAQAHAAMELDPETYTDENGAPIDMSHTKCIICMGIFKCPYVFACGHSFCEICTQRLQHKTECPTCRRQSTPQKNHQMIPFLDMLTVACPNSGCSWKGPLAAAVKHGETCTSKQVRCVACDTNMPEEAYDKHIAECGKSLWTCCSCKKSIPLKDTKKHDAECPCRIIACPFGFPCTWTGMRSAAKKHTKTLTCKHCKITCPYNCGKRIALTKMDDHIKNSDPRTREIHKKSKF